MSMALQIAQLVFVLVSILSLHYIIKKTKLEIEKLKTDTKKEKIKRKSRAKPKR